MLDLGPTMAAPTLETAEPAGLEASHGATSRWLATALPGLQGDLTPRSIVQLQRTIGNRAVRQLLSRASRPDAAELGDLYSGPAPQPQDEEPEATNRPLVAHRALARREFRTPPEEIRRSLASPGRAEVMPGSRALSLYNFGHDRADPKRFHREVVIELAGFIREEMKGLPVRVRVDGNTSSPGTDTYNLDLGRRRARAIAAILKANGVTDVEIVSHGKMTPAASNDSEDGRSRNRRVDLQLVPGPGPVPRPGPEPPKPDPKPPGPGPGPKPKKKTFCEHFRLLCNLPIPIPIPFLPLPFGLICLIAPELCIALPCIIDPALCVPKRPDEPPKPPDKPEPPKRPPRVVFEPVRAANTPSAMGDRIPDRDPTPVAVTVFDYDPTGGSILIRPVGASSTNGDVEIDGDRTASILGSTVIDVKGTTQTSPSVAGFKLQLEAVLGTTTIGLSRPFAVSDLMENMSTSYSRNIVDDTGAAMVVAMAWESDGAGGLPSLNEVTYNENLQVLLPEEGSMVGLGVGDQGPTGEELLAQTAQEDKHGTPRSRMSSPGKQELMQVHTLRDYRTGSTSGKIPVTNSGFLITRVVEPDPTRPGCLRFVITKVGRAGTANGLSSGAGRGTSRLTVPLPCPPSPGPGPNGGGGTVTPSLPTPFVGPLPTSTTKMFYVGGVPKSAFVGEPVVLTILFHARSTDPKHPGTKAFTSPIPCIVTDTSSTAVTLRTTNPFPFSLAPRGFDLTVMPAFTQIPVPRKLIK
jgi:outer membrane protein OmpA-like peptidoglycan-associated protein